MHEGTYHLGSIVYRKDGPHGRVCLQVFGFIPPDARKLGGGGEVNVDVRDGGWVRRSGEK